MKSFGHVAAVGTTAALAVLGVEALLSRLPELHRVMGGRTAGRFLMTAALAWSARRAGASDVIPEGVVVGAVAITVIDTVLLAIPRRRLNPPTVTSVDAAGEPWAPRALTGRPYGEASRSIVSA